MYLNNNNNDNDAVGIPSRISPSSSSTVAGNVYYNEEVKMVGEWEGADYEQMQWLGVAMDGEGIVVAKGDNKCGWCHGGVVWWTEVVTDKEAAK
jgi:hypothetical protein